MKKRLTLLCLVFFLILPSLTSCSYGTAIMKLDKKDRAAALFDAANQIRKSSYLLRRETKLSGVIDTLKTEAVITYDSYFFDLDTDTPTIHFESAADTTVYVSSEPYSTSIRTRAGFRDGKMYVQNSPTSSLYSNITAKDYFEYLTQNAADEEKITDALKSAENQDCQKNGDGSWYAGFNRFPEDSLNLLVSAYFDPAVFSFKDAAIEDLIVHIETNKKLELTVMQFTLLFDKNASAQTTVKLLEADKDDLPKINFFKFTEVSDLRFLDELKGKINEKFAADSFGVSMKDTVTITQNGRGASLTQTDSHISFSDSADGITFEYTYQNSATPDVISELQYRDGVLYATSGGSETVFDPAMNEYEARSYLFSLIDPGNLAGAPVSEFKSDDRDPNKYILYIESPSIDKYYYQIGGFPVDSVKTSARIELILKDGEISEYRYYLTINAEYYNYKVRIVQSNTRIFE